MRYWIQFEEDAFEYYGDFSKEKAEKILTTIPKLSALTINGSLIDRYEFIDKCTNDIISIFSKNVELNDYKFYLIANIELRNRNSRIERYKKVWKSLQRSWSLDSFNKGPEIEMIIGDISFYSSIAEFTLNNYSTALKIVESNPRKFAIIASKRNNFLTESSIKDMFKIIFDTTDIKFPAINYFNMSIHYCQMEDIIFRWGDSSEEITLGLIFKSGHLKESICYENLEKVNII